MCHVPWHLMPLRKFWSAMLASLPKRRKATFVTGFCKQRWLGRVILPSVLLRFSIHKIESIWIYRCVFFLGAFSAHESQSTMTMVALFEQRLWLRYVCVCVRVIFQLKRADQVWSWTRLKISWVHEAGWLLATQTGQFQITEMTHDDTMLCISTRCKG